MVGRAIAIFLVHLHFGVGFYVIDVAGIVRSHIPIKPSTLHKEPKLVQSGREIQSVVGFKAVARIGFRVEQTAVGI